jgi:Fe-S oxidoreductase
MNQTAQSDEVQGQEAAPPVDVAKVRSILASNHGARMRSWLDICSRCGLCAESCFFYLAHDNDPKLSPAYKVIHTVGEMYRRGGRVDREFLEEAKEVLWGQCTMCRRCSMFCPFGIDMAAMIGVGRSVCTSQGVLPEGLANALENMRNTGNQMAVSEEDYLETLDWMAEEYGEETHGLVIPVDKQGAKYMYTVNPREPAFYPQDVGMMAQILHVAEEDWTMPSKGWDGTNLAMFAGHKELAAYVVKEMYDAAQELGVEQILMTECGHAYRSGAFEGPYFLGLPGGKPPLPVKHAVQLFWEYIVRDGRIKIDPARKVKVPVTLQDPCNQSRSAGLSQMLRELTRALCDDFRDMSPSREYNHCCGGGGGFIPQGPPYKKRRMASGKVKAEQIRATGAEMIIVPCHNCFDQINDLNKEYDLGCKVVSFKELIVESMIVPEKFIPPEEDEPEAEAGAGPEAEAAEAEAPPEGPEGS